MTAEGGLREVIRSQVEPSGRALCRVRTQREACTPRSPRTASPRLLEPTRLGTARNVCLLFGRPVYGVLIIAARAGGDPPRYLPPSAPSSYFQDTFSCLKRSPVMLRWCHPEVKSSHPDTHAHMCKHEHACIVVHIYAHMHALTHRHACARVHTHARTCTHCLAPVGSVSSLHSRLCT